MCQSKNSKVSPGRQVCYGISFFKNVQMIKFMNFRKCIYVIKTAYISPIKYQTLNTIFQISLKNAAKIIKSQYLFKA